MANPYKPMSVRPGRLNCESCNGDGIIGSHACPDCNAPEPTLKGLDSAVIESLANECTTSRGSKWWTFNREELMDLAMAIQIAAEARK